MPRCQKHWVGKLPGVDHGLVEHDHRTRDRDPENDIHPCLPATTETKKRHYTNSNVYIYIYIYIGEKLNPIK